MHSSVLLVVTLFGGLAHAVKLPLPLKPVFGASHRFLPSDSNTTHFVGKLAWFDQLIDHDNPSQGTFKQRYWWNADHYAGPGSPISLAAPSEVAVLDTDSDIKDMGNQTLPGLLAQYFHGAHVVIEHRFFGSSSPPCATNYTQLTDLEHLTLKNAIQDLVHFAQNVVLPFDETTNGSATNPSNAPWLLSGCSYAGALTAWTNRVAPGTFWAYEAGSAPVETKDSFWDYLVPIKNRMNQNCTTDLQRIIARADQVTLHGTPEEQRALQSKFPDWQKYDQHFPDFLTLWLFDWQRHQIYQTAEPELDVMCDFIENQRPHSLVKFPGPEGVGLDLAIEGLARGYQWLLDQGLLGSAYLPESSIRSWGWLLCNEPFEWAQGWSSADTTGLHSRTAPWQRNIYDFCDKQFPAVNGSTYGLKAGRTYHRVNQYTGGWRDVRTERLLWVSGEFDPWREVTVSSSSRPGGPLKSTPQAPVFDIPGAAHCNDYVTANAETAEGKVVFDGILAQFRTWLDEFYEGAGHEILTAE